MHPIPPAAGGKEEDQPFSCNETLSHPDLPKPSAQCAIEWSRYCLSNEEENEWINVVNATQIYCWAIVIYYLFIEHSNFPPFVSEAGYIAQTASISSWAKTHTKRTEECVEIVTSDFKGCHYH